MSESNRETKNPEVIRNTIDSLREPIGRTITDDECRVIGGIPARAITGSIDKTEHTYDELAMQLAPVIQARAKEVMSDSIMRELSEPPSHLFVDGKDDLQEQLDLRDIRNSLYDIQSDRSIAEMRLGYYLNFYLPIGCDIAEGDYGLSVYEEFTVINLEIEDTESDVQDKVGSQYSVSHQEIIDDEYDYKGTEFNCVISGSTEAAKLQSEVGEVEYLEFPDRESMVEFFNACIANYVKNERSGDFFSRVINEFNSEEERVVLRKAQ